MNTFLDGICKSRPEDTPEDYENRLKAAAAEIMKDAHKWRNDPINQKSMDFEAAAIERMKSIELSEFSESEISESEIEKVNMLEIEFLEDEF